MKQKAERLYKELTSRASSRYDDDYDDYDDDYDDYDDSNEPLPPRQSELRDNNGRRNYNNEQQNNGDRFLELFDDLASTITEDSKKYRVDAINKEFGLDNLLNDNNTNIENDNSEEQQQDDPSSKTSDEGENNGSYGVTGEEMIQIPKKIANNLERIYVKYFNVHKVIKELKDIFSNEQLRMRSGSGGGGFRRRRQRQRNFMPY